MDHQDAAKISGPALLSILLNSGLLGVLSVQVLLYYIAYPNDRGYMKCLVYGIYFLEFIQSILIIQDGFRIFVTSLGDVEAIDRVATAWLSVPILTAVETTIVQGFYVHRISILARSKKVLGAIIVLAFIQLGGGIAVGVQVQRTKYYSLLMATEMLVPVYTSVAIWNIGGVLCDIIIAICMTYYLSKGDTTYKATKAIIKKIIRLSIETGSLTAVVGIVSFSLAILPTNQYYYQTPMGIIGKFYANSMLFLINSRMLLQVSGGAPLMIISTMRFDSDATPTVANDSHT